MSTSTTSRINTRSQQLAEHAFAQVQRHEGLPDKKSKEYIGFSKRFPALVHTCGLAQAGAFAQSKAPDGYLEDLRAVMNSDQASVLSFASAIRSAQLMEYVQLSRTALEAAGWLKRYAEALLEND